MAYTTIDDPSAHFQTALYSGNASTNVITNDGNSDLQPDWVWIKNRSTNGKDHVSYDSSRGVNKQLYTNNNNAEDSVSNGLTSFNTDGFTLGDNGGPNASGYHVAWQWKANGGSRTTNAEDGHNPGGGYQANTTAGFSIVDYTGVYTSAPGTKTHGLGAVPHMIVIRNREIVGSWIIYHHKNTAAPETDILDWSSTAATYDNVAYWNDTAPTSSVFTINTSNDVNKDADGIIAYCFTSIQGYSKFGSYTGNGNDDGPFVYTGFKPAFFIQKRSDSAGNNWNLVDNKRSPFNIVDDLLYPDSTSAEYDTDHCDFLSNGIKMRDDAASFNADGGTYIYMAFAENPFVTSGGVPCTAR